MSETKERNLDFDTVIERRHTNSIKYDFAVECGAVKPGKDPYGLLPLWVADMDFKTSSFIQNELVRVAEYGIFGYTAPKVDYYETIQNFYRRRHNYNIEDRKWIIRVPSVMFALSMAIKAFTENFVRENLKGVKLVPMESTYLAWLDFNGTGLSPKEIENRVRNRARLWLNNGILFGKNGEGFQRLNLACPRCILVEALKRLKVALG